ncbi:MAG: hypothetical protein OEV00_14380, partial [Acidobacteriota bacterium]|nr:hypothetical protein [Acidobacteriota bacterium]
ELPTLPRWTTEPVVEQVAMIATPLDRAPTIEASPAPAPFSWTQRLMQFWLATSALVAAYFAVRIVGCVHMLRKARPASSALQERVTRLGRRVGLKRTPPVFVLDAVVSPFLWWSPAGVRLYLPQMLLASLSDDECDAILLHELAHYARRDPWGRPLEILIVVLCWWNPLTALFRRQLRQAEEQACDAWVLARLPQTRRPYADALIKTLQFLNTPPARLPSLATGASGTGQIKERLTMILKPADRSQRVHWLLPVLVLASLLLVLPTWADLGDDDEKVRKDQMIQLKELHQQQLALERQVRELQQKQEQIRAQYHESEIRYELDRLRSDQHRLTEEGEAEHAEMLAREIAMLQHEADNRVRIQKMELEHEQRRGQMSDHVRQLSLELEQAHINEDQERARQLERELRESELDLERQSLDALRIREMEQQAEIEQMKLRHDAQRLQRSLEIREQSMALESELKHLQGALVDARESGDDPTVAKIERDIASLKRHLRQLDSDRNNSQHEREKTTTETY